MFSFLENFFFFGHRSLMRNSAQTAVTLMTIKRMLENLTQMLDSTSH